MFFVLDTWIACFTSLEWVYIPMMAIVFWVFHWAFRLGRAGY